MNRHPGGQNQTLRMLENISVHRGASCLDLGAGDGESVRLLKNLGFRARGIDKKGSCPDVEYGDFLHLREPNESMDLCLSQCAFLVSGDQASALREAYRVLKYGGYLILADLDTGNLAAMARQVGFVIEKKEDLTALWREYYIEAIWNDTLCCADYGDILRQYSGKKLRYTTLILRKEESHGSL